MNFNFASLGGMISYKTGMSILKTSIEKTILQKIEDFDLIYMAKTRVIDLRLYNYKDENGVLHEKYRFKYLDSDKFMKIVDKLMKEKGIEDSGDIDVAIVNYNTMKLNIFATKDGEKINLEKQL